MSEYESVQKGALKLKGTADGGVKKKKKKKDKKVKHYLEQISSTGEAGEGSKEKTKEIIVDTRTKAERVHEEIMEKRAAQDLLKEASKTHKQRILEFNKHLDSMTEHFDIPKVSWTK